MEKESSLRLLRMNDVLKKMNVKRATLYKWMNEGLFPKPKHIGKCIFWNEAELDKWIKNLK
jgi:prophage regulatory protein